MTWISRSGAVYGRGRSKAASMTLNMAVLLPIPTASARTATTVNPGSRANARRLWRRSTEKPRMDCRLRLLLLARLGAFRCATRFLARGLELVLAAAEFVHLLRVLLEELQVGRVHGLADLRRIDRGALGLHGRDHSGLHEGNVDHDELAGSDRLGAQDRGDARVAFQRLRLRVERVSLPAPLLGGESQRRVLGDLGRDASGGGGCLAHVVGSEAERLHRVVVGGVEARSGEGWSGEEKQSQDRAARHGISGRGCNPLPITRKPRAPAKVMAS